MSDQSTSRRQPYDPEKTPWTAGDAKRNFGPKRGSDSRHDVAHDDTHAGTQRSVRRDEASSRPREMASSDWEHVSRRTRKARLRLTRVDPWSVLKTALLFGVAGAIILFIAVWVVWGVIGVSGAFESINKAVNDLVSSPTSTKKFQLSDYVNTGRVLGLTAVIGVIDAVLFTALSVVFAFLYNLAAQIMGGLELTLADD